MFDFSIVTQWVHSLLTSFMPEELAVLIECIVIGVCIMLAYAVIAIIMIFMERKVCAAFQCRLGPMRVGPQGTIQVFADVFKMLIKEIITIRHADKFLYNLAPYIVILASIRAFSCLPINKGMEVLDFNVGIFFLLAASSIGVVGILLAGWSSNNKYSLIGAMRSGAQMISYELSVGLSILTIVILTDTMQLSEIVERQADGWFLFKGHIPALIAFIIYLIAGNAEVNRGPFDLPEAESELTAGYHTEYSGMHFGLYTLFTNTSLFLSLPPVLCGRICKLVYHRRSSHNHLPGRMDAATYSWARRIQCHHGLYTRIYLVLWQVILCSMVTNVDQMDISPSAY